MRNIRRHVVGIILFLLPCYALRESGTAMAMPEKNKSRRMSKRPVHADHVDQRVSPKLPPPYMWEVPLRFEINEVYLW
ncbi:hypothetical protein F5B17DRAFT_398126 [Nemania serpens]|nr:hypothetical protein F5B17DRAFT_398126 [Nemania serpens]